MEQSIGSYQLKTLFNRVVCWMKGKGEVKKGGDGGWREIGREEGWRGDRERGRTRMGDGGGEREGDWERERKRKRGFVFIYLLGYARIENKKYLIFSYLEYWCSKLSLNISILRLSVSLEILLTSSVSVTKTSSKTDVRDWMQDFKSSCLCFLALSFLTYSLGEIASKCSTLENNLSYSKFSGEGCWKIEIVTVTRQSIKIGDNFTLHAIPKFSLI